MEHCYLSGWLNSRVALVDTVFNDLTPKFYKVFGLIAYLLAIMRACGRVAYAK